VARCLVSVIMPTYNRAYCLPRAIDSILVQTHTQVEVIVIDDGSTDGTRGLVVGLYGHDPRVKYIYQQNTGVTGARNRGLALTQGDYIALLDSDDVWMPWKLALQLACFRHCPQVGMVWTDMQAVSPDGVVVNPKYLRTMYHAYRWFTTEELFPRSFTLPANELPPELADTRLQVGEIFSQMVMGNLVHTSTVLLSRERFEKVRGFNEALRIAGEDYDFHLRTCREGPVGFVDVASIRYQTGMPDRLTANTYRAQVALNCLATVMPVVQRDRDRIRLPRSMIRGRLAEIHDWIGDCLLERGQVAQARRHLMTSLWFRPLQLRPLAILIRSILPGRVGALMHRCWRGLKKMATSSAERTDLSKNDTANADVRFSRR
jgi:GT2 family glycosyltransferase